MNHLVRNDFVVELDNRVIKTSPFESHTGNPAPKSTSLLNRILVGRRDDDDKQPRFQKAWFLGLIGSDEVIALHPDGVQRHHGEWRFGRWVDTMKTPTVWRSKYTARAFFLGRHDMVFVIDDVHSEDSK